MNNPLVNQAAMVLPVFLLSACLGGGGSFDLDSVDTEAPRPAPKYQDVPSKKPEARKDQGGYGFAMRFKRRNWHRMANENEVKLNESDWEQTDNEVHITSAAVQGGFYGPKAEELGGWFAYPGNGQTKNAQTSSGNGNSAGSATVVFGAKRQELVQ